MADNPVEPPDEALIGYVRGRLPEAEAARISGLLTRRGKAAPLKAGVDEAIEGLGDDSPVEHVLVVQRTGIEVPWTALTASGAAPAV